MSLSIYSPHYGYDYQAALIQVPCPVACKIDASPGDSVFSLGYYVDNDPTTSLTIPPSLEFGFQFTNPGTASSAGWHTLTIVAINQSSVAYSCNFRFNTSGVSAPTLDYLRALAAAEAAFRKALPALKLSTTPPPRDPPKNVATPDHSDWTACGRHIHRVVKVTVKPIPGTTGKAMPNVGVIGFFRGNPITPAQGQAPQDDLPTVLSPSTFLSFGDLKPDQDGKRNFDFVHLSCPGSFYYSVLLWHNDVKQHEDINYVLTKTDFVEVQNP
jgi:hypothetical protein